MGVSYGVILSTKMIITRKIKIDNLVFLFIQPIPDLSCKFEKLKKNCNFEKFRTKKILIPISFGLFWWGAWAFLTYISNTYYTY